MPARRASEGVARRRQRVDASQVFITSFALTGARKKGHLLVTSGDFLVTSQSLPGHFQVTTALLYVKR